MAEVQSINYFDLKEIAYRLKKFSRGVVRVKVKTTREDILKLCDDDHTKKSIDIIHSATIEVDGVTFELLKKQ